MKYSIKIKKSKCILSLFEMILVFFILFYTIIIPDASLVSSLFTFSFAMIILDVLLNIKYLNNKKDIYVFIGVIFLALFNIYIVSGSVLLSFEYLKKYIIFSCTIISILLSKYKTLNSADTKRMIYIGILTAFLYIFSYYFNGAVYLGNYLTFGFSNPNLTAMFLLQSFLYCIVGMYYFKNVIVKVVLLTISILLISFIFETESRNCIISIICFLVFLLVFKYILKKNQISKIWTIIASIFPIIFSSAYMLLINSGKVSETLSFLVSEGKNLNSRVGVWTKAYDVIFRYPLTGNYYLISDGSGMSQMHNSHVDIIASYGMIVFVFVIFCIYITLTSIQSKEMNDWQFVSLLAFFCVIFMGFGEAALFSGGLGIYFLSTGFLLIANSKLY